VSTLVVDHPRAVRSPSTTRASRDVHTTRLGDAAVQVDLSCALGVVLVAWTFAAGLLPETDPGLSVAAYWAAGLVGALTIAGSLLLHELGHAIAARRAGLGVSRITLSFAGGTSEIIGVIRCAADELLIAVGGPLASVVTMLAAAVTHIVIVELAGPGLPATVAALVAGANLALVLLNAIPGLPFDGGRVLRATVWALTRRPEAVTRLVPAIGRRLSDGMIGVAVLASAFGFVWIALWAGFLGFVVRENSS
jgi:Zn-dependent protease